MDSVSIVWQRQCEYPEPNYAVSSHRGIQSARREATGMRMGNSQSTFDLGEFSAWRDSEIVKAVGKVRTRLDEEDGNRVV